MSATGRACGLAALGAESSSEPCARLLLSPQAPAPWGLAAPGHQALVPMSLHCSRQAGGDEVAMLQECFSLSLQ